MSLANAPKGLVCRIIAINAHNAGIYRSVGIKPGAHLRVVCHHPDKNHPRLVEVGLGDNATISLPGDFAKKVMVALDE